MTHFCFYFYSKGRRKSNAKCFDLVCDGDMRGRIYVRTYVLQIQRYNRYRYMVNV